MWEDIRIHLFIFEVQSGQSIPNSQPIEGLKSHSFIRSFTHFTYPLVQGHGGSNEIISYQTNPQKIKIDTLSFSILH